MNAPIHKDLYDAIEKNLPALVGDQLRTELADLAKLRIWQADNTETIKQLKATVTAKETELAKRIEEIRAHDALSAREAAVLKREQAQDLNDLRVKLADERRADAVGLVHAIFRSPVMTRTVQGTVPIAVEGTPPSQYNQNGSSGFVLQGVVDTKTTEAIG